MKPKFQKLYMEMAELMATASYSNKKKVGAVAVKDHRILSTGYNGTAPGDDNTCEVIQEDGSMLTLPTVIHAEQNLIYKMARDGESAKGADLFCTLSPCKECAKAIVSAGFKRFYWRETYRDTGGIEYLVDRGVEIIYMGNEE